MPPDQTPPRGPSTGQSIPILPDQLDQLRRDRQRMAIDMQRSMSPQTSFNVGVGGSLAEAVLQSGESKASKTNVPKLTKELEIKLYESRDKIEKERSIRYQNSIPPQQGRREQQYLEHARKHKHETMSALEILHSEVPVCVDGIGRCKVLEIIHTLHPSEISGDSENNPTHFFCAKCGLDMPSIFAYFCNGHLWCASHVPDLTTCAACNRLTEGCKKITTYDERVIMACDHCLRNRKNCGNCGNLITPEYVENGLCSRCMDSGNDHGPLRTFSRNTKWIGKKAGDIVASSRVFSCEIEAMTKDSNWPMVMFKALPKEVGISEDGSLRNNEGLRGFELQTPKLAGSKGEELVRHMTTAIKNVNPIVNDLTGMHIHLDGAGIIGPNRREYPMALLQLWRTYIVFEDVIMSFLPFSRRRNDYCRPMSEAFKVNDLDIIESLAEAERFWYKERTYGNILNAKGHQYHASRYFGANFHSLLAHGHFEVRFHSGTLNANKILQWANLHALIMDACGHGQMDVLFFREAQSTYNLTNKTDLLFDKIGLAQSSRQYYRSRQKTFAVKKNEDDETKKSKKPSSPQSPRITSRGDLLGQIYTNNSNIFSFSGLIDAQTISVTNSGTIMPAVEAEARDSERRERLNRMAEES